MHLLQRYMLERHSIEEERGEKGIGAQWALAQERDALLDRRLLHFEKYQKKKNYC